ncbi:hypothetical protein HMPREF9555_01664 [Selenomonas artemidis F0399]|uniref:Uncharacterized protein n=1 Tax=Selenomonas artemidis F0399 TaxID=749551 RepID=E7N3S5_9FIRM|nr:hypothetical protein HMPREF9555_01664 [Selenomonas artemidis F0399]
MAHILSYCVHYTASRQKWQRIRDAVMRQDRASYRNLSDAEVSMHS